MRMKANKRLTKILMSFLLIFSMVSANVLATVAENSDEVSLSKEYFVDDDYEESVPEENKYTTIQGAIDAIRTVQNGSIDGSDVDYVIKVAEGTYDRFLVYHKLENITIQGAGEGTVIQTLNGSALAVDNKEMHSSDGSGIIIWGANIT